MEPIRVPEHVLTEKDLVQINWPVQSRRLLVYFIPWMGTICAILLLADIPRPIVGGVFVAGVPLLMLWYRFDIFIKQFRGPHAKNFFRARSYEISESGFAVWGEEGLYSFVPWSHFTQFRVLDDYIFLHLSSTSHYAIPRKHLPGAQGEAAIRVIQSKIVPVKAG